MDTATEEKTDWDRRYFDAFVAACKLVWDPKKLHLTYIQAPAIPERPINTGLSLVKKEPWEVYTDRVGSFFKTYNFIQYKCDGVFDESDLYRDLSYILIYKVQHEKDVLKDCTLTIIYPARPDKLLRYLENDGFHVWQGDDPDIWYVDLGFPIKVQVVVSEDLVREYKG